MDRRQRSQAVIFRRRHLVPAAAQPLQQPIEALGYLRTGLRGAADQELPGAVPLLGLFRAEGPHDATPAAFAARAAKSWPRTW